jgi:uncharacterized protein involved in exopolysaccharide biosynthesis
MENQTIKPVAGELEEIDLRDLIATFTKRIWLILGVTLAAAVLGLGVTLAMPKVYRAQMLLEIGSMNGAPVAPIGQVKDNIDQKIYSDILQKKGTAIYPIKTANIAGSDIVSVTADGADRQQLADFLDKTGRLIIAEHDEITAAQRQSLENKINSLKSEINNLKQSIQAPSQNCSSEKYVAVVQMENSLIDFESAQAQIKDTAIVSEPAVSQAPVSPKIMLNTILAVLLGFFAGTFLAFGIEWWKQPK